MRSLNTLLLLLMTSVATAQVGINTSAPDASAALEVQSETQGVLMPRMTSTQRDAIVSPATGLMVFDTTVNSFQYYDGTNWVAVGSTAVTANANDYTGWADYVDTQYTSASPFIINSTKVTLPNNAGTVRDTQLPIDIAALASPNNTFYNNETLANGGQKITGRNGDGVNIVIEFKARPNTNNDSRLTVSIDIGFEIYKRDFVLSKGNDEEHFYLSSFNAYTLGTWEANGGAVKISCTKSTDIYDVRYVITRTHRAR